MSQINVNTIAPQSGSSVTFSSNVSATDVTGSFGRIEGNSVSLTGDLIAHRYLVSSSITNVVIATNSGSSAFGDTLDDVHRFTGSLELTGSVSASKFIGDGALLKNVFEGTTPSASISTRLTSFTDGSVSLVSGSSTSTGSFGRLQIARQANIGAGLTVQGSNASIIAGSLGVGATATNQVNYSSVSTALTINGSSTSIIELATGGARKANFYSDGTDASIANNSSGKFEFLTDNNYRMSILADGKVGIGTRSPGVELEVVGSISGSATSTGSFGRGSINELSLKGARTDGGVLGVPIDRPVLFNSSTVDTYGAGLRYSTAGGEIFSIATVNSGTNILIGTGYDLRTSIGSSGNTPPSPQITVQSTGVKISGSAAYGLEVSSGNISGSSNSTGSFGVLEVANAVMVRNTGFSLEGSGQAIVLKRGTQTNLRSDASTGGVALGPGASATGDGVGIGYGTSAGGGSSVAIGRGLSTGENQVRIGESGVTDAYLGQGNANLHINAITASGDISGSSTSTGSFGAGYIDNKLGINTKTPLAQLHVNGGAYNESIIVQGSGVDSGITFKDSAGNIDGYVYSSGGAIGFLDSGGSYAIKHINDSKTEFRVANTIVSEVTATMAISGSASSTGSFGAVSVGGGTLPFGRVAINGANANVPNGPHIKLTTDSDVYPLFSVMGWQHDNISLFFDSYYDGATRSSDAGSNFRIHKNDDKLKFLYDSGVSPGSTQSYKEGILLDASGNVEVPTGNIISSKANGLISGSLTSTGSFGHVKIGGSNIETFISSSAAADGFGGGGSGGSGTGFPFDGQAQITGSLIISGAIHPMTASLHITDNSFTDTHILSQSLVVAVDGNNGRLFSVTDQMSGSLFSANTVAGLPVIEAFSDNKVTLGPFSNQTVIDSDGNTTLGGSISGSLGSTGSFGRLLLNNRNGDVDIRNSVDGAMNVVIGDITTGAALTSGTENVIIGPGIAAILTGENNVYIGSGAAGANNAANNNTVIGYQAMSGGNNNANNTVIGFRALNGNNASNQNVAVGYEAGKNTSTGGHNVFMGYRSGDTNTTGETNVTLGSLADVTGTGATNQIALGYNITAAGNNQTAIGNSDQTHVVFGGSALISGSAASTGSFGQVKGDIIGQRPIVTHIADFSASMDFAGRYNIVHGGLTCSILTHATTAVDNGTEYEFFQTSSLGNMLFETGSGVSLYVKNDNLNIAGQYSGASLKKVATNTWHLVGDLT